MKESGCETPKKNPGNVPRLIHESLAPNPLSRFFLHQLISRDILKKQVCTPSHPSLSVTKQNKPTLLFYRTPSPDTLNLYPSSHRHSSNRLLQSPLSHKQAHHNSFLSQKCQHTVSKTQAMSHPQTNIHSKQREQRFYPIRTSKIRQSPQSFTKQRVEQLCTLGQTSSPCSRCFKPLPVHRFIRSGRSHISTTQKTQNTKKENFRFAHASNLYFTFMYMQIILELLLCLNLLGVTTVRALLMSLRDSTSVPSSLLLLLLLAVLLVCSRPPAPVRQSSPLQVR
jgi:hypothetical protein